MPVPRILIKKNGLTRYSKWPEPLKLIWVKFGYFSQRKVYLLKVFKGDIFIIFVLNQLNMLIYSKTKFLKKYTIKNRWNVFNRKSKLSWNIQRLLSLWQKHIPTKHLEYLSMKIIIIGKDFICSFNFLFQRIF